MGDVVPAHAGAGSDSFDEMLASPGRPRPHYARIHQRLQNLGHAELRRRQRLAERAFRDLGITFTVYQDERGIEKLFPLDLIPRILEGRLWARLERGLVQRVNALNLFLDDVYGEQRILRQGAIPSDVVLSSVGYAPDLVGLRGPHGLRCHVAGIDLVCDGDGEFLVLEDNLRTPSGISYVLANRQILKRVVPELFVGHDVRSVDDYCHQFLANLRWLAGPRVENPTVVLLTPGIYNSAYFEHWYLAKQMGIDLVEGSDLLVDQDRVFTRTTDGLKPVDVIYRRIDDEFLDPLFGRPDSVIGVPGLVNAYRAGGVVLANGLGNGVADDKAVYALVPEMIRYYLGEEPILANVPTYLCAREDERRYVLEHLEDLVVKTVASSGGYGMLMGPMSSRAQRARMRRLIEAQPRQFIAQPVIDLSMQPVLTSSGFASRHQDLRPFVLCGAETTVTSGGLTRVALRRGSLVVNSSQGGGSRDTWVMAASEDGAP
jgi:uncharacterized circularly permuted ATP-grasp superfamily protein